VALALVACMPSDEGGGNGGTGGGDEPAGEAEEGCEDYEQYGDLSGR
jgi:hypothetical protein